MNKLVLFFFFAFSLQGYSQEMLTVSGIVKGENGDLPFVNIGIKGKNTGTISDASGKFKIAIKKEMESEFLTFSFLGYEELSLPVKSILNQHVFLLKPKYFQLNETIVVAKKSKIRRVGTKSYLSFAMMRADADDGIQLEKDKTNDVVEVANLIRISRPSKILKAHIYINTAYADTGIFRINFYNRQNGEPSASILAKDILVQTYIEKPGWYEFDIANFNINVEDDFFIAFTHIPVREKTLYYSCVIPTGSIYYRYRSLDNWVKEGGGTSSIYVTLRQ